jgi:hypothetical protein
MFSSVLCHSKNEYASESIHVFFLEIFFSFIYMCIQCLGHFSLSQTFHYCDTETNNLKEERFILVHGFRGFSPRSGVSIALALRQSRTIMVVVLHDGEGCSPHGGQEAQCAYSGGIPPFSSRALAH